MSVNVITHSITSKHNNNNNNVNIVIVISIKIVVLFQTYYNLLKYIDSTHMAQCISFDLLTNIYLYTYYKIITHIILITTIPIYYKSYHCIHNIVHIENNKYISCIRLFNGGNMPAAY